MRLLVAFLAGITLFAQGKLIPPAERKDVSAFEYTDWPNKNKNLKVADSKGKVMVLVFLREGNQPAKKSLGEVRWLQEQEAAMGMVVAPIYDVSSAALGAGIQLKAVDQGRPLSDLNLVGEGMFRGQPIGFRVFCQFSDQAHTALFPKFEGQPAIFILDRQGRIANILFGYQKGTIAKAVKAVLEEPAAN